MLILTEKDKAMYEKLSLENKEKIGLPHFSKSSLMDSIECHAKLDLRNAYRTMSLAPECGSNMHEIADQVATEATKEYEVSGRTFKDLVSEKLKSIDYKKLFVDSGMKRFNDTMNGEKPVQFKAKEKVFFSNPETLKNFYTAVASWIPESVFTSIIDNPVLHTEVSGFTSVHGYLVLGVIDDISTDGKTLYIDDIKSSWSASSKPAKDDGTRFQLWLYRKMVSEHYLAIGADVPEIKTRVKWIKSAFPRKDVMEVFNKPLQFDTEIIEITHSDTDVERYERLIKTGAINIIHDCGKIGNTKFGCAYCGYVDVCRFAEKDGEGEN